MLQDGGGQNLDMLVLANYASSETGERVSTLYSVQLSIHRFYFLLFGTKSVYGLALLFNKLLGFQRATP